jgi:hypothetical protein
MMHWQKSCICSGVIERVMGKGRNRGATTAEQLNELQPRIAAVDVMQNKVRVAIEQSFPRPGDRLEVKMQAGTRAGVKELPQKPERDRQRAEVANDDAKLSLLPHRELCRVHVQTLQFSQQFLRSAVKRTPDFSQSDAIAASV